MYIYANTFTKIWNVVEIKSLISKKQISYGYLLISSQRGIFHHLKKKILAFLTLVRESIIQS